MSRRIGSMCTGYGGLDAAVLEVFGGSVAWHAEVDPDASKVLAYRFPWVPNLGDLTAVDWSAVEPVDIVTAGFPCQDISYAGRGEGIQEGNRSGLWHHIADALGVLRPRLVVLENVAAIVARRPGLDFVLADLADLGLDAEWTCVRASDVGAPHGRDRWFLVAHPADERHERGGSAWGGSERSGCVAADTQGDGRHEGRPESARLFRGPDAALGGGPTAADADRDGLSRIEERDLWQEAGFEAPRGDDADGRVLDWGKFRPSIERWEQQTGRAAPDPTEPGRTGPRLSPRFVEWLMGLPAGFVTDVPGISRNAQLRILGNGVVPRQAAYGLRILMAHLKEAAA